jgi:hypothetical protein
MRVGRHGRGATRRPRQRERQAVEARRGRASARRRSDRTTERAAAVARLRLVLSSRRLRRRGRVRHARRHDASAARPHGRRKLARRRLGAASGERCDEPRARLPGRRWRPLSRRLRERRELHCGGDLCERGRLEQRLPLGTDRDQRTLGAGGRGAAAGGCVCARRSRERRVAVLRVHGPLVPLRGQLHRGRRLRGHVGRRGRPAPRRAQRRLVAWRQGAAASGGDPERGTQRVQLARDGSCASKVGGGRRSRSPSRQR